MLFAPFPAGVVLRIFRWVMSCLHQHFDGRSCYLPHSERNMALNSGWSGRGALAQLDRQIIC